jgi:pimeloyl-ACP methyl ester carboxylesterase
MDEVPKMDIDKYLSPLSINGMNGRMLHLPAPKNKNREILVVYGHHASLERVFGLAQAFNRYGSVTTPDMPGFGGMDSFYKIGKKPSIDTMADYLAAFIKMRYKKRPVTIIAVSLGFAVTTRMLQKYPSLVDRVDLCVSAAGFIHKDDLTMSYRKKAFFAKLARFFSWRIPGLIAKAWLRKWVIRRMYKNDALKAHSVTETAERRQYRIEFEVWLWQNNDIRTHFFTLSQMLTMNLCTKKIALPVHHVAIDADQYLDNHLIEQHMRVVYSNFVKMPLPHAKAHAPTILATAKEAGAFIPPKLRKILNT